MNVIEDNRHLMPVPGFSGYLAHAAGGVFLVSGGQLVPVKQRDDGRGYLCVDLKHPTGKWVTCKVHRVVKEAFCGPAPKGKHVDHFDHDRVNNNVYNLRWRDASDNSADIDRSTNLKRTRITDSHKAVVLAAHAAGVSVKEIRAVMHLGEQTVRNIIKKATTI